MAARPRTFSVLGYDIEKWSTLLKLLMGLLLVIYVLVTWLLPNTHTMEPPSTVNFFCDGWTEDDSGNAICPENNQLFVQVNPITFNNRAKTLPPQLSFLMPGRAFSVKDSKVRIDFLDANDSSIGDMTLHWFYFNENDPVGSVTVSTGQSISREIKYYARRSIDPDGRSLNDDRRPFREFEKFISDNPVKEIKMTYSAELEDGLSLYAYCFVPLDDKFKRNAAKREYPLYSRTCFEYDNP